MLEKRLKRMSSFVGLLPLRAWLLLGFIVFVSFALSGLIGGKLVSQAVEDLKPLCEEKYGADNYVIGKCGALTVCCQEKPKKLLVKNLSLSLGGV